jgi:hypothetical protein
MPILVIILLAIFGAGVFEWQHRRPAAPPAATANVAAPGSSWQERCGARFLQAHRLAVLKGSPYFQRGEVELGGGGDVYFRLAGDEGVIYSAGVSGFQSGHIPNTSWMNLNGDTGMTLYSGAELPGTGKLSLWRDRWGRSGFVAGLDPDLERMRLFTQMFQPAVDDCLVMAPAGPVWNGLWPLIDGNLYSSQPVLFAGPNIAWDGTTN